MTDEDTHATATGHTAPPEPARTRPPVTVESLREIRAALGYGILFMVIGGFVFTLAGFGFTAMMGTSCFEGFCAYVPFLYFAPLGLIAGFVLGAKIGRAKARS
ncbi:hypothetical protein ABB55_21325 [Prosthecomicrobium hirschii]|uniref:Uncharacterized protein n=1 Tax=Prosthecodimorpha hirschii TaxID=665126 RepID=A0A0P6WD63_9HYPH|nr:hypothetical protein [Prosthecomicrobium hirschii]KPL54442.1 hypothetical protein ABB55_21325 [Prosthecomicrobium hirschii]